MKNNLPLAISLITFLFSTASSAASQPFLIRTVDSSISEYEAALKQHLTISYSDHLLFEAQERHPPSEGLTEALEQSLTDPQGSLEKFQTVINNLNKNILNSEGRELLASIYLKISSLHLPERISQLYLTKAKNLIAAHAELQNIYPEQKTPPAQSNVLNKKEVDLLLAYLNKTQGLPDAIILLNGEKLNGIQLPNGEQQWSLVSNTFSPIIFYGTWSDFNSLIENSNSLKPLVLGSECNSITIQSDDFQVQTQAQVFAKQLCPVTKNSVEEIKYARNLTEFSEIKPEKFNWTVPVILTLAAGLAYSLKDKNVSLRMPNFH